MSKKSLRELINEDLAYIKQSTSSDEGDNDLYEFEDIDDLPPNGTGIYIFKHGDVVSAIKREFRSSRKDILRSLYKESSWKPFAIIEANLVSKLDDLGNQFANFKEVIELCQRNLHLFRLATPEIISFPPILLTGPPGVGKTRFMSELAQVLGTDFFSLDFSTLSSGFVLNGGSSSWSDSQPGFISESIRKSRYANPVIMLDEIDKVTADTRFDPLGPLYGLLESHTACRYRDEYLDIPMNLSGVLWVATANEPDRIPAPIRSRMIKIKIDAPDPEQSRSIVKAIYKELLSNYPWGKHFSLELDEAIVDQFAGCPPRLMKLELEKALAKAAYRTDTKDRPICIHSKDVENDAHNKKEKRGMGFLAKI
ncbi:AAA family ATPase [Methylophaga sp.]|uniref:AAA family ATPase n=1 Tax=Methylophaga sp. TaxID=2024840 RepID=UPI003A92C439